MMGFLTTYAEPGTRLQDEFDVAVVMPSLLRPCLRNALQSIYAQDLQGRIQILVGVDMPTTDPQQLDALTAGRPPNCTVQVLYPGYSTSVRHGGQTPAHDGGALRCILTYLANSSRIAYLDDDNWWRPDHLRLLSTAMEQADWAYSLRWFVHPQSGRPICVDQWESVGPGRGVFKDSYLGFVDPNCLMLNKQACHWVIALWNRPMRDDPTGLSADRQVFAALCQNFRGAGVAEPTTFYTLNPNDGRHPLRVEMMRQAYERAGAEAEITLPC